MKKLFLIHAVIIVGAGGLVTSCQSQSDKIAEARENVREAEENLQKVQDEPVSAYEQFKLETTDQIDANDKAIADFRDKLAKKDRPRYEKRIAALQQKNNDLRKRLDEYKGKDENAWTSFKVEFKHDMDELAQAIKDLMIDNK